MRKMIKHWDAQRVCGYLKAGYAPSIVGKLSFFGLDFQCHLFQCEEELPAAALWGSLYAEGPKYKICENL